MFLDCLCLFIEVQECIGTGGGFSPVPVFFVRTSNSTDLIEWDNVKILTKIRKWAHDRHPSKTGVSEGACTFPFSISASPGCRHTVAYLQERGCVAAT